jgi:hypothetical protein
VKHETILFTWILVASMQTLRCTGDICQVVPQSIVPPRQLTRFDSRQVCEDYRRFLLSKAPPDVHSQGRPDVTIRKQMTFTCRAGGMP